MKLLSKIFSNARKPEGFWGRMIVAGMNGGSHAAMASWGLDLGDIPADGEILDIGCGGGANLKRLMQRSQKAKVTGVDYSPVSVEKSRSVNADAIASGRCKVLEASVESLPFEDNTFDIITAFETVYFWPNIEKSFGEVKRVLKPGGIFLIGTESNGSDNIPMRISEKLIDMTVYNDEELTRFLTNNDYSEITVYLRDAKNKEEIVKTNGEVKRIPDDYDNISFTDKFVEWMTVVAKK